MRYLSLCSIVFASTLFVSCSLLLPHSHEAYVGSRVTSIDLSMSHHTIFFQLDSLNSYPASITKKLESPKLAFCPIYCVRYVLSDTAHARLEVYDAFANLRVIWDNLRVPEGEYKLDFRDLGLERGIYFVKLLVNGRRAGVHKLLL
jgi:hypothetical protein